MVEIGAGGGSIARVNKLEQIITGPDSAGSFPGPACYSNGGSMPQLAQDSVASCQQNNCVPSTPSHNTLVR